MPNAKAVFPVLRSARATLLAFVECPSCCISRNISRVRSWDGLQDLNSGKAWGTKHPLPPRSFLTFFSEPPACDPFH